MGREKENNASLSELRAIYLQQLFFLSFLSFWLNVPFFTASFQLKGAAMLDRATLLPPSPAVQVCLLKLPGDAGAGSCPAP